MPAFSFAIRKKKLYTWCSIFYQKTEREVLQVKLSMWMIANQMTELDVKLEIREDAPAVLNSARLAYATNCVHIYQEKDYVVCDGEGDRIYIYDMDITRAFELVQSVFDSYEDWISMIREAVKCQDYQKAVDTAFRMFKNPIVLFDANNKVLGMTSAYGEHDLDSEWAYLSRYGYSSLNAVNMIKYTGGNSEFYSHRNISYLFPQNPLITLEGISYCVFVNNVVCGRINLIAKERKLNQGDAQLLEKFTDVLQAYMGLYTLKDMSGSMNNVFLDLMMDRPYDRTKLKMQMNYQEWTGEETYYVALIRFMETEDSEFADRQVNSLFRMLLQNLTDVSINVQNHDLILLADRNLAKDTDSCLLLRNLVIHNPVQIGFSLPDYSGIKEIPRFYRQAEYALERNKHLPKPKAIQYFENMAPEYILTSSAPLEDKIMACMPSILRLWQEQQNGSEMFRTLFSFLSNERSVAHTSAELFLHRNTTVYRIKKIQENMKLDLEDPEIRNYCYISMLFLKAYENCRA